MAELDSALGVPLEEDPQLAEGLAGGPPPVQFGTVEGPGGIAYDAVPIEPEPPPPAPVPGVDPGVLQFAPGAQPAGSMVGGGMGPGPLTPIEAYTAAGMDQPLAGGFGGGAGRGLVRRAEADLAQARGAEAQATEARQTGMQKLAEAQRRQAENKAAEADKIAGVEAESINFMEAEKKLQQQTWEAELEKEKGLMDEIQQQRQAIRDFEVGPGQKTRGEKAFAALAIAFSAFGAAVQRQQGIPAQNIASEILQQQLDNEMRIQEAQLNKMGKDLDYSTNLLAQTRQIYQDDESARLAARGHQLEIFKQQIQQIKTRSSSDQVRQEAEIFEQQANLEQQRIDEKLAQQRSDQAAQRANQAHQTDASNKAAAARARRQEAMQQRQGKYNALLATSDMQQKIAQAQAKAAEQAGGKPISAERQLETVTAGNEFFDQLAKIDMENLPGIGAVAGTIHGLPVAGPTLANWLFGQEGIDTREAAKQISKAFQVATTGAGMSDTERQDFNEMLALLDGAGTEDEARAALRSLTAKMVGLQAAAVQTNPGMIKQMSPNQLDFLLQSKRITDPQLIQEMQAKRATFTARGAQ